MNDYLPGREDIRRLALQGETIRAKSKAKFFVAGPYIDLQQDEGGYDESKLPQKLRHFLYNRIGEMGHDIYLGEHAQLLGAYKAKFRDGHNAHIVEYDIARSECDGVIIIPSSPGSFAEFGTWAHSKTISAKMLVIIDAEHEKSTGYVNSGPAAFSKFQGAQIVYHTLSDVEGIWSLTKPIVENWATRSFISSVKRDD